MIAFQEQLFTELRGLVADLGKDGGLISPAIYDTAQLLRLYPPPEGVEPGLNWLISQQEADGGWGDPAVPTARDVPTLAALLAIFTYCRDRASRKLINAGLEFLEHQSEQWMEVHIDTFPVATEMLLPYLIHEACEVGLTIDPTPYARLFELREKKLQYIRQKPLKPGTPPAHSWEALGLDADASLLNGSGSVGHSPAATAAWLKSAAGKNHLQDYIPIAERYLSEAAKATGIDIPGVVTNPFPIAGYELSYGLYALHIAGIINHGLLSESIARQGEELYQILTTGSGVSFGNFFVPDVDCTSTAVVVLYSLGYDMDPGYIWQFQNEAHFYTYKNELNPSILSNAHALYALTLCGERAPSTEEFLLERQQPQGHWFPDKWHSSWRYMTMETILTLLVLGYDEHAQSTVHAIIEDQRVDGGWGMTDTSSTLETAYCILALQTLYAKDDLNDEAIAALKRGYHWLLENYNNDILDQEPYWYCKELYSPYRIDRIYVLSALLSVINTDIFPVPEVPHLIC